jgi:hypothetical protein
MPLSLTCPSCSARLSLPEKAVGKRLKCPRCRQVVPFREADLELEILESREPDIIDLDEPEVVEDEVQMVARMAKPARKRPPAEEEEVPKAKASRRPRPPEDIQAEPPARGKRPPAEAEEAAPLRRDRPKKKKRKGKRPPPVRDEHQAAVWAWWVFGGGGVFLVMCFFAAVAVFADFTSRAKFLAIYMLFAVPASTVIFFVAMYLSSVLFGALEMGDLRVAVVKAFILVLLVTLVSLLPGAGFLLTLPVWLIGIFGLFRLDLWEARMLLATNWVLNWGLKFALIGLLSNMLVHGAGKDAFGPSKGDLPADRPGMVQPAEPDDDR